MSISESPFDTDALPDSDLDLNPEAAAPSSLGAPASAAELASSGALDSLFEQIDAGQVQLSGTGGLIPELIKGVLERGLQAEMSSHLGYEKGDSAAGLFENHRNGSSEKTVLTEAGNVPLSVPRDRQGTFTPRLVPKGQRRLGGLDEMIVSLYAGGMTMRDIQHHLASTIGTELSHETISKITDEVLDEVLAWQTRPLEALYPVVYLDALVVVERRPSLRLWRRPVLRFGVVWRHDPRWRVWAWRSCRRVMS